MAGRLIFLFLLWFPLIVSAQQTPVIDAVHDGHAVGHEQNGVTAILAALKAGDNVNERDQKGWTPLMHAALECRAEEMQLLLDKGADPKLRGLRDPHGDFMLSGQAALLLASGCFIARRRAQLAPERHMPEGYAAYELAAPEKMVHLLIDRGADVNSTDIKGRTPLMMASMQGWPEAVRALLDAHADIRARDRNGHTVLDFVDPGEKQLISMLKDAGAPAPSGHSARVVCDAQRKLDQLGYDMPINDCIDGQQFSSGVRKFQQSHSLNATGELDLATMKALNLRE